MTVRLQTLTERVNCGGEQMNVPAGLRNCAEIL